MQHTKGLVPESIIAQQILNQFDFTQIDEMDPSLVDDCNILYDAEIPFQIKFQDQNVESQDLPNMEPLRIRVFESSDKKFLYSMKIELSSDNDLFFHFTHNVTMDNYGTLKQDQHLNIDFVEYPQMAIKCFTKCEKDQQTYAPIFTILTDGQGQLDIFQSTEYKNVNIMNFNFQAGNEDFIRQFITYKYMSIKSKLALMEGRLSDVNEIVRIKNPQLQLQIQKQLPIKYQKQSIKN